MIMPNNQCKKALFIMVKVHYTKRILYYTHVKIKVINKFITFPAKLLYKNCVFLQQNER